MRLNHFWGLVDTVFYFPERYIFDNGYPLLLLPPAGGERDSKGASPFGAVRVGRFPGEGRARRRGAPAGKRGG